RGTGTSSPGDPGRVVAGPVVGREVVVTQVVVGAAVELRAAAAGDRLHVDGGGAELRRVVAHLHFDFGHELVVRHVHRAAVVADVAHVGAVEGDAHVRGARAVDAEVLAGAAESGLG